MPNTRIPNPTLDEMLEVAKATPCIDHREAHSSIRLAIYTFANEWYQGEHSNLYKAMCALDIEGDVDVEWLKDNDPEALYIHEHLTNHYCK
jgi:hypothetical protein